MSPPFPEPVIPVSSRAEVGYLDYFRSRPVSKLEALTHCHGSIDGRSLLKVRGCDYWDRSVIRR
jgi:hypothetical protein